MLFTHIHLLFYCVVFLNNQRRHPEVIPLLTTFIMTESVTEYLGCYQICCIYRAPNTDLNMLSEFINDILSNIGKRTVYMCGDFNVDLLQYDKHAATNDFIDKLYVIGLHPLITRPTRITSHSKTLIDNIFTTDLSSHIHSGLIINDMSDHLPIYQITEHSYKTSNNLAYSKKRVVNEGTVCALVNGVPIDKVSNCKYLGHCINDKLIDDDDMARQRKQIYAQGNALVRKFYMCTETVRMYRQPFSHLILIY